MNKMIALGAIIIVLLILIVGAYWFISMHGASSKTQATTTLQVAATSTLQINSTSIPANSTTTSITNSSMSNNTINSSSGIKVSYNPAVGNYLTNSTGFTLYIDSYDIPNSGKSVCYSSCATYWPPFYTSSFSVPRGVNSSAFTTINRTNGTKQLTYYGQPLYYYLGDSAAGDIKGQGIGGSFYVATVPQLNIPANAVR